MKIGGSVRVFVLFVLYYTSIGLLQATPALATPCPGSNGGATRTMALLAGSPAIDAVTGPDCPPTDQRGWLRPFGAACDIGTESGVTDSNLTYQVLGLAAGAHNHRSVASDPRGRSGKSQRFARPRHDRCRLYCISQEQP